MMFFPWGGNEDGASLIIAVHSGRGRDNGHKLKWGRFRLDTGEKLFSYFPITNYLNMLHTAIPHLIPILFFKRKSEHLSPCDEAGLMVGEA